ncbi:putative FMN-dependent luciferase-like monooxygenase [Planctomonas deserti]|uniref:putative FMN-dependent luciferase-like monooxygenase n=1 Tax=Planctomonas deserti TaxID=2144185 RepID=UPI000D3A98E9|nr:putative FMN-dependent luciferase-like monooxygenase [Planctomonas deserti]
MTGTRLGFFTRLLDAAPAAVRYRNALEQIELAERLGFDSAWVAQHHFRAGEGGLPAPFVFLSHAAARTSRIRLATGIVTLPLENPVRVAEDAAVLDLLSGGRLEVGVGSGGTPSSFAAFGQRSEDRSATYDRHLAVLKDAWRGDPLTDAGDSLYPAGGSLLDRVWQATFSVAGGRRAGLAGDGLMLSRTQPRPAEHPDATLADLQVPIIEAYLDALPDGVPPRILASRSVFVSDDRGEARRLAADGLGRAAAHFASIGQPAADDSLDGLIRAFDQHLGEPDDVAESLAADPSLAHATDVAVQVHSVDPPHPFVLRSIELFVERVAPLLGWRDAPGADSVPVPAAPTLEGRTA